MFWTPKAPPTRLELAQDVLHDKVQDAAQSLEALKDGATAKIAAARAQLDAQTKKALQEAEKEAHEARRAIEIERAQLLADHEKWKADLQKERAQLKRNARQAIAEEYDEIEFYEGEAPEQGGFPIFLFAALVLVGAALYFAFSGAGGRRTRAAIKDRLDQVKDGLSDATTKSADQTAERLETLAPKSEAKAEVVARETAAEQSPVEAIEVENFEPEKAQEEKIQPEITDEARLPPPVITLVSEPEVESAAPSESSVRTVENEIEETLRKIEESAHAKRS